MKRKKSREEHERFFFSSLLLLLVFLSHDASAFSPVFQRCGHVRVWKERSPRCAFMSVVCKTRGKAAARASSASFISMAASHVSTSPNAKAASKLAASYPSRLAAAAIALRANSVVLGMAALCVLVCACAGTFALGRRRGRAEGATLTEELVEGAQRNAMSQAAQKIERLAVDMDALEADKVDLETRLGGTDVLYRQTAARVEQLEEDLLVERERLAAALASSAALKARATALGQEKSGLRRDLQGAAAERDRWAVTAAAAEAETKRVSEIFEAQLEAAAAEMAAAEAAAAEAAAAATSKLEAAAAELRSAKEKTAETTANLASAAATLRDVTLKVEQLQVIPYM